MDVDSGNSLSEVDLRDGASLLIWLTERFAWSGLPPSRWLMSRGVACALRAVANGHEPARLFSFLVDRGLTENWRFLTPDELEAGEKRLAEITQEAAE